MEYLEQMRDAEAKDVTRRSFLKSLPAGVALASSLPMLEAAGPGSQKQDCASGGIIRPKEHYPFEISSQYKPFDQMNVIQLGGPAIKNPEIRKQMMAYALALPKKDRPGYDQVDYALRKGAFSVKFKGLKEGLHLQQHHLDLEGMLAPGSAQAKLSQGAYLEKKKPSHVLEVLEGNFVHPKKHKFSDKLEASRVIKRAARLYGVDLVGITKRDPNFDYDPLWDPVAMRSWPWTDFPFEPKSVIVIGFSMDYQAVSTAPSFIADAATGEGYSRIHKSAYQLSVFLKNLGYQAVPVENELGLSVPYAEMAGLGEHGRHGLLITPEYGPRVRLGKVYTDLDYIEYDRPVDLGVTDFCKICKRCAEQCPTKAITFEDDISFEPKYDVEGNWFNNPGVKKFYNNTLLCWQWWTENGDGCSSCIVSCPFNKPDFWHHRLIQNINTFAPRPLHSFMRDMDKAFGYGDTFDKDAPARFWLGE